MQKKDICVIGLGAIGLPTALLAAEHFKVHGFDIDADKIFKLQNSNQKFIEPQVSELLTKAKARKTSFSTEIAKAHTYIVCTPTPLKKNNQAELKHLHKAISAITQVLEENDLIVIESTVPPETCEKIYREIKKSFFKKFHLAHCPERAIPGNTIKEIRENSRIIGGATPKCAEKTREIYKKFTIGKIHLSDLKSAETCKIIENAFRDLNIAFVNELCLLGEKLKINMLPILKVANEHPRVQLLSPSPGVGGHCIPIDPWFLIKKFPTKTKLLKTARQTNLQTTQKIIKICKKFFDTSQNLGILGLAYKKNINDLRESPALTIIPKLQKIFPQIFIHDPLVKKSSFPQTSLETLMKNSSQILLLTDHEEFENIDFSKHPQIKKVFDTRNQITPNQNPPQIAAFGNWDWQA
jgi:UDP-N-acetyl-D-mannosaminuronic acid dehydrogenase